MIETQYRSAAEPPVSLRVAAWAMIITGAILWLSEISPVRNGYVVNGCMALAAVAGLYTLVRAWRRPPGLRWLGLTGPVCAALYRFGGPLGRIAGSTMLIILAISALHKAKG